MLRKNPIYDEDGGGGSIADKKWGDKVSVAKKDDDEKHDAQADQEKEALKRYQPKIESKTGRSGKGWFSKKKAGLILGGLGLVGSIIALVFSFLQGPLQFLQLANTAQRLYSHVDDLYPDRAGKLVRYMRNLDNPANRRMSLIGNRVTDTIRTKLEADGMTLNVNSRGYLEGIEYKGRSIDLSDMSNRARRAEFKAAMRDLGYGKITTALASRPIFEKFGINLKPFGNVRRSTNETIEDFKNKIRDQKDTDINDHVRFADCSQCGDLKQELENEKSKPVDRQDQSKIRQLEADLEAALAQAELNRSPERIAYEETDGPQIEKTRAAGEALRSKISSAGGSAVAIVGLAFCTVRQMGNDIITGERSKVETVMNLGVEANAMADQIKAGTGGINMDELAVSAERFNDVEGNSWIQNDKVNYVMSGELKGTPQSPSTVIGSAGDDAFVKVASAIGGPELPVINLDTICAAMGNIIVQGVLATGEFVLALFSGGATAAAKVAISEAVEELVSFFVSDAASGYVAAAVGDPIPAMISGPDYGAAVMTGNYINSNILAMESGGRNLSSGESLQLTAYLQNQESYINDYKSIADKYFDLNKPTTLAGGLYASAFNGSFENPLKNPVSIPETIAGFITKPITGKVFAQSPDEVFDGIQQVGFAVDEFEGQIANEDPFVNEQKLYQALGNNQSRVDEALSNCINTFPTLEDTDAGNRDYLNPSTPEGCDVSGDNLLRLRLYAMDLKVINSLGCISGDTASCNELGVGNSSTASADPQSATSGIIGNSTDNSVNIECAEGTRDLGTKYRAWVNGEEIPTRLCAVIGFKSSSEANNYIDGANGEVVVNSRVSGAVVAMYQAALNDDVVLTATSSFRTYNHQDSLKRQYGDGAASPGYSTHQSGTAIDFTNNDTRGPSNLTCENKETDFGNPIWEWVNENARDYGFKQLSFESWHWDTSEKANRC